MKTIEVFLKNLLLNILLKLNKIANGGSHIKFDENSKVLFIRLNRIGDALVTTPLLKVIKENTGCKTYILADRKNHFVYSNNPNVDEIIINQKGIKGFYKTLKIINSHNFQVLVDLHDDISATVSFYAALSNAKHKFALEKDNKKLFTKTIKRLDPRSNHVVDRILKISELFGIQDSNDNLNIQYFPKKTSMDLAEIFISEHFKNDLPIVGINISAGSNARYWGTENFQKLLKLLTEYDLNPLLLTSPKDFDKAVEIANNKLPIYHSENFDEFCAIISKLNLLFTPDTSIVHIASAFEIPMFGIYVKYNTDDMIWSPYKSKFETVITEEPNFDNLDFESVKVKLVKFLESLNYKKQ